MALVDNRTRGTDTVARLSRHNRSFGSTAVLREVDLAIRPGEFLALLGRSGSGKSTLLRSLAGLDPSPSGEVVVDGRTSVAFQEPRLLPWRRVGENVALALLNGAASRQERRERAHAALEEVGLTEKIDAWPLSLSGGQAQRVSLARALVSEPDLLLLDEPFSALDALTRIEMHRLVDQLWRRHSPAVLLVTHDVDEALTLADRVLVLDEGRVAREWRVEVRRGARTPQHPEIAEVREQVLASLGVHHETTTHHALETGAA
ncbi:ABC transporter ATP-binding protein [Nocardioides panacis]|uniref:ABC transporter ATP-binding protein n=1 Tax=Nocardioides panacis TaxID=2849501 RepID=A0A975SV95_9ACTN|nr:ABC transporter ATP-binding protein [Nocardioides panacis]QWZ06478.1 ABC transporter ATP-binding protein [Nocardioides panacis]